MCFCNLHFTLLSEYSLWLWKELIGNTKKIIHIIFSMWSSCCCNPNSCHFDWKVDYECFFFFVLNQTLLKMDFLSCASVSNNARCCLLIEILTNSVLIHRNITMSNIDTWTLFHPRISSVVGEPTKKFFILNF